MIWIWMMIGRRRRGGGKRRRRSGGSSGGDGGTGRNKVGSVTMTRKKRIMVMAAALDWTRKRRVGAARSRVAGTQHSKARLLVQAGLAATQVVVQMVEASGSLSA